MATCIGPLATINCELRQAWKGATVTVTSCAGVWLVQVATLIPYGSVNPTSRLAKVIQYLLIFN